MSTNTALVAALRRQLDSTTARAEQLPLLLLLARETASGDSREALAVVDQGLRIADEMRRDLDRAELLTLKGMTLDRMGNRSEGRRILLMSARIYEGADMPIDAGRLWIRIGSWALEEGGEEDGLTAYETALKLFQRGGDRAGMIETRVRIGDVHSGRKEHARACENYLAALDAVDEGDDLLVVGGLHMDLGLLSIQTGERAQGIECLERAQACFREAESPALEIRSLVNLAGALMEEREDERALEVYIRALAVYDCLAEPDPHGKAVALLNIGLLETRLRRRPAGIDHLKQAFTLFHELDYSPGRISALYILGSTYREAGWNHEATLYFREGIRLAEEIDDVDERLRGLDALQRVLEEGSDIVESLRALKEWRLLHEARTSRQQGEYIGELHAQFDLEESRHQHELLGLRIRELEREALEMSIHVDATSLQLVERSRMIDEMLRRLEALRKSAPDNIATQIRKIILDARETRVDPEESKVELEHAYPALTACLARHFPMLGPVELRVCVLTVREQPTKTIASILHVGVRAVQTTRYRIRKKLDLGANDDLKSYLDAVCSSTDHD